MVGKASTIVRSSAVFVPALVFAASGIAKVLSPQGTAPRSLQFLTRSIPYDQALRALGGFEVLLSVALVLSRSQRRARLAGMLLVLLFTAFVAVHAGDAEFLQNCGCFGAIEAAVPAASPGERLAWMALRNAALSGVLAYSLGAGGGGVREFCRAFSVAILVFLGALSVGESSLRREAERTVQAAASGHRLRELGEWVLPDLALVDAQGRDSRAEACLRAGDHIVFFSPSCGHCRSMSPAWGRFARMLEARGGRLVLVAVDGSEKVEQFKREGECSFVTHYTLEEPLDGIALGIEEVPSLLVLGPGRRVVFSEASSGPLSFTASMASWSALSPEGSIAGLRSLGEMLLGPLLECEETSSPGGALFRVRAKDHEVYRIATARYEKHPAHRFELALAIDQEDVIAAVLPLSVSSYQAVVDPGLASARILVGKTMAEAIQIAGSLAGTAEMHAPSWSALAAALKETRESLRRIAGRETAVRD